MRRDKHGDLLFGHGIAAEVGIRKCEWAVEGRTHSKLLVSQRVNQGVLTVSVKMVSGGQLRLVLLVLREAFNASLTLIPSQRDVRGVVIAPRGMGV